MHAQSTVAFPFPPSLPPSSLPSLPPFLPSSLPSLYAEHRTVVSGLAKYLTLDELRGRKVVMLCNLKPANMKGRCIYTCMYMYMYMYVSPV